MTTEEIHEVLTKGGFTYYNDDKYNNVYIYGGMEIIVEDITISFHVGSLQDGLYTSLRCFSDELYSIKVSDFENLKRLTILTNDDGKSEMYFK